MNLQEDLILKIKAALERDSEIPHIPKDTQVLLEEILLACEQGKKFSNNELIEIIITKLIPILSLLYQTHHHT